MPVPVAVTHPTTARKLQAAENPELPSEGPFARLAKQQAPQAAASAPAESTPAADQPGPSAEPQAAEPAYTVETHGLNFSYPGIDGRPIPGVPPVIQNMNITLQAGSTCILIGPNGAGKTTLLKVLGGKHMVPEGAVRVLGRPPFHDTQLTGSGDLAYVGGNWERDIAFAGYSIPLQGDFPASRMINSIQGIDPARREKLMKVLDINPSWRMHQVSDGQRRRVQICLGLLKPYKVLLLDEITVDLDVLGRADLMAFLKSECQERGATVIYATHIFDGLEDWPSHLLYVAGGQVQQFLRAEEVPELQSGDLLKLVERWLRQELQERKARRALEAAERLKAGLPASGPTMKLAEWNNGFASGRLASTIKDSANAVWRT